MPGDYCHYCGAPYAGPAGMHHCYRFTARYFGPDDGKPRHDWCRADDCISCGCVKEKPCNSHSEARGYRDWATANES